MIDAQWDDKSVSVNKNLASSGVAAFEEDVVSAIIVNYNGQAFIENCISSLRASIKKNSLQIIIVDNCSTDGSRAWLAGCKDIFYIESATNLGFTGGNNLGASHAIGDRLLFINNDTVVNSDLDGLIAELDDPEVGVVGCRLIYGDGRQQFSFGYEHTPLRILCSWLGFEKHSNFPALFRRLETNPDCYTRRHNSLDWLSGACFAIRKKDWLRVQGFDTAFFMYCEDVDLCARVRSLGMRIVYTEQSTVTHFEGAGKEWIGVNALNRTARSYLVLVKKHYGLFHAILISIGLGVVFILRSFTFFIKSILSTSDRGLFRDKAFAYFKVSLFLMSSFGQSNLKVD